MTYATEFPDFPASDMPAIPEGFADESWHNDACPSFTSDALGMRIWIDYVDASQRETFAGSRFIVNRINADGSESDALLVTDEWRDVLRLVYADVLAELANNNGACLYWQMTNGKRAEAALRDGIITMDEDSDLLVHPDATQIEAGMAYTMESAS